MNQLDGIAQSANSGHDQASNALCDNILTYGELSERLKIPERSLKRMVMLGDIPHRRVRRFVRFYWPDIVRWLQNEKGARKR